MMKMSWYNVLQTEVEQKVIKALSVTNMRNNFPKMLQSHGSMIKTNITKKLFFI